MLLWFVRDLDGLLRKKCLVPPNGTAFMDWYDAPSGGYTWTAVEGAGGRQGTR